MKANRAALRHDEAVSPVIATILMVAITVVLAATVYVFVTGFGSQQTRIVTASFAAKAIDLPSNQGPTADGDTSEDAIELTFVTGQSDYTVAEVTITIDGLALRSTTAPAANGFADSASACTRGTSKPGGDATWARGESVFLWASTAGATCNTAASLAGGHLIKVTVQDQVVLDTRVEIRDSLAS